MKYYYTVYDNHTDRIIAYGTAKQCADILNIKKDSFIYAVSRQKRKPGKRKYTIVVEKVDADTEKC